MSFLSYLQENQMLTRLKEASAEQVKTAFFANYFAALVMLKLQDIEGLKLINDPESADLTKFKDHMSDINFWAKVLFDSGNQEVKARMLPGHSESLLKNVIQISKSQVTELLKVPTASPDKINWNETVARLLLLKLKFNVKSSYTNNLIKYIFNWNDLSPSGRRKAVSDSFMFLFQSDPQSALLPRMRALSNSVMLNDVDGTARRMIGFSRLAEDGDGGGAAAPAGTSTGNIGSAQSGIGSNQIVTPPACNSNGLGGLYRLDKLSPNQVTKKSKIVIKDGKIIKKVKRGFQPRKYKLPDHLRAPKKPEGKKQDNEE